MQSETCGHWENKGGEVKLHRAHTLSDIPTYALYHMHTIGINNYMVAMCLPEQGT